MEVPAQATAKKLNWLCHLSEVICVSTSQLYMEAMCKKIHCAASDYNVCNLFLETDLTLQFITQQVSWSDANTESHSLKTLTMLQFMI